MRVLALVVLLLLVPAGKAQEKQAHPGYSPTLMLASAAQQGGKVVVQIQRPGPVLPPADGTVKPGDRFLMEWVNMRKGMLGETVQAFKVDGRPVGPKALLKALAEPRGVAVFMRSYTNDPRTPPPFYRALLRKGTILLVARAEDLYHPKP